MSLIVWNSIREQTDEESVAICKSLNTLPLFIPTVALEQQTVSPDQFIASSAASLETSNSKKIDFSITCGKLITSLPCKWDNSDVYISKIEDTENYLLLFDSPHVKNDPYYYLEETLVIILKFFPMKEMNGNVMETYRKVFSRNKKQSK